MSFSVSKGRPRLSRKLNAEPANASPVKKSSNKGKGKAKKAETAGIDMYVVQYSEKSFVVMGDTLSHSDALTKLGGKYNTNLRVGQGWIFAKAREDSVKNYIETGEIVPYVYPKDVQNKYQSQKRTSNGEADQKLIKIFRELRDAFDADAEYDGKDIIEVIHQLEEKYLSKKSPVKAVPKKKKATPPPDEPSTDESEGEMESEADSSEAEEESEGEMESEDEADYEYDE